MPSYVASQFARHFAIKVDIANAWISKHQGYFYDSLCAAQNDPEAFQKFVTSFSDSCDTKTQPVVVSVVESRFVEDTEKDTKESHEKIATDQSTLIDAVARLRIARAQHRFATRALASAKIEVLQLLNQSIPTKLSLQLLA